ncbi:MAG: DUF1207 domain-containing protein [Elusimicrobiota bacterium]|nr:MAG: DUF1207 domain-containing protein [Elusimicrobiota bacterium]
MRANALLAVLLACPAAADSGLKAFPRADELFPVLLAAPKQFQLAASRYVLNDKSYSDLSLGHAWGLLRGRAGDQMTQWQWDARAMSYSRWGGHGLEAVDLLGELPVAVRRGDVSALGSLFYESSHLGDDHIRRTGRPARRTNATGLRLIAAIEPWTWLRTYGGASFLLDTEPSPKRWGLQAGAEVMSGDLGLSQAVPVRLYAAEDLQFPERVGFNPNSHAVIGAQLGWKGSRRTARLQVGYYSGHSYFGQFQADREHFADVAVILEL